MPLWLDQGKEERGEKPQEKAARVEVMETKELYFCLQDPEQVSRDDSIFTKMIS